jgi:hypothetical protein
MKVLFFTNPYYHSDNYSPEIIQLADGFVEIGWTIEGNENYWKRENDFLIPKVNVFESNPNVVIVDFRFAYHGKPWSIKDLLKKAADGCPIVLLDRQCGQELSPQWNRDGWYDFFHLLCITDRTLNHPKQIKIKPWQIGVIKEVYSELIKPKPYNGDENWVLHNFRVGHSLRDQVLRNWGDNEQFKLVKKVLIDSPSLSNKELLKATGGRFNASYFESISKAPYFLVVGGYICTLPVQYSSYSYKGELFVPTIVRIKRKINSIASKLLNDDLNSNRQAIIQWDSFRFWEGIVSPTCPISLDIDHWSIDLVEKPVEGVHYIGLTEGDGLSPVKKLEKLTNERRIEIALNGRSWFDKYYSPKAQAERLISWLNH